MSSRRRLATIGLLATLGSVTTAAACAPRAPIPLFTTSSAAPSVAVALPAPARMPGPDRGREAEAVIANAECVRCHTDVAREWSASLHHSADTEPAYRASFDIEPLPFCRACHAPEANPDVEESADVRELGVGCVTCHVTEPGAVLAVPRTGDAPERASPHRVIRDARFAGVGACAGCHEFAFPGREVRSVEDLMQGTIAEHAESPARDRSCADCHMPAVDGKRRGHQFVASRDAASVGKAIRARGERVDASHVRVVITPAELGHAFPTGDLFRRVEVAAFLPGQPEKQVVRYLARHFGADAAGMGRKLLTDDRVRTGGAEIVLDLASICPKPATGEESCAGEPLAWAVTYQRVSHPNGIDERAASLEGELELASGVVP